MNLKDATHLAERHGANPRVHPNGFIQLDIAPTEEGWDQTKKRGHSGAQVRLHIWNPPGITLPRQETVNEIHDHVFDMRSTVVKGRLIQRLYHFVVGSDQANTHEVYRAVYDKASSSRLQPTGVRGVLVPTASLLVDTAKSYTQPAFTLHDTSVMHLDTVVTIMEKEAIHEGDATVVCPLDVPPDNDFDRAKAVPEQLLWEAIWRSLER